MSQIKFSCPNCTQNISAGFEACETEIVCPTCQTRFLGPDLPQQQVSNSNFSSPEIAGPVPTSAKWLAWYYILGSLPFVLFSLFGFSIPEEELTNQPDYIERDRNFLLGLKILMFGAILVYSILHLLAGIGLLRLKKRAFKTARILSILGIFHLNPLALPGLIVCSKKDVARLYGVE